MSVFLDIFAALLAGGLAAAWVLTGGDTLPLDRDPLRTDSADKMPDDAGLRVIAHQPEHLLHVR